MSAYTEEEYRCSLRKADKRLAKDLFGEEDHIRDRSVRQFRLWLVNESGIRGCRQDAVFLLRFLRYHRYDLEQAKRGLLDYVQLRHDHPRYYTNLDYRLPAIEDLTDHGFIFRLPDSDNGEPVFIHKGSPARSPSFHGNGICFRAAAMHLEAAMDDERIQVHGIHVILDYKDISFKLLLVNPLRDLKAAFTTAVRRLPLKYNSVHIIHLPHIISYCAPLLTRFLTKRLQSVVFIHKDLDELKQHLPERILPKEYGGEVPLNVLVDEWKAVVMSKRELILSLDNMKCSGLTNNNDPDATSS